LPTAEGALGRELTAALESGPSHAYLFTGPRGSGKRAAARAFAAELLAAGAPDPESARRRAMAEPPSHPDLVWVRPPGGQHLVEELRERVIRAASLRPLEGETRVFVIEAAEAMREESQNALLKTLEEPASFAHLILLCAEPEALAATIASRCQTVTFKPLAPNAVAEQLGEAGDDAEVEAVSRLCGGDVELARMLLTPAGRELRSRVQAAARAASEGGGGDAWRPLLESAEEAGAEAGVEAEEALRELSGRADGKLSRDDIEQRKRVERRARTESLDLALGLCGAWFRDLAAVAEGAPELAHNSDRLDALREQAEGLEPQRARLAVELVLDTRRRLDLNVSEELALEALWYRLADTMC
jgi:DNA polymerase III subunit delta'